MHFVPEVQFVENISDAHSWRLYWNPARVRVGDKYVQWYMVCLTVLYNGTYPEFKRVVLLFIYTNVQRPGCGHRASDRGHCAYTPYCQGSFFYIHLYKCTRSNSKGSFFYIHLQLYIESQDAAGRKMVVVLDGLGIHLLQMYTARVLICHKITNYL